ncbi:MAG: carbohydrate ABC transporter substrate-binding protein [Actinobacteria bacterium]|nr:carbohydrate ABC transporter substrate-binding protein [Actinomycetota bacterium]
MNARAFKAVIAAVFAITASVVPLSQGFAAGETLGAKCTTEGYQTGTKSTSLICVKSAAGKLTWQRVKLNAGGRPVQNLTPPKGEIEFWHYRPEPGDQRAFVKIIADFEAKYPGTKIKQVFTDTTSFNATARVKILANPKAALFATSRGAVFDSFAKSDMMLDLSNQRYVKQNLITKGMLAGQYEGKQLGVPYQYLFNNPIVNTELWAKEKWTTPKNLSGWVAWCKDAKAKGYVPLAWPGATRGQAAQISNSALMNSAASYDDLAKNLAMSMILTDGPVVAEGIMNNTFILSVNKNSSARDQQIANAFLSYLVTGKVAQIYANESLQHVNVLDVDYTNVNLLNTSSFQAKNTMLAPRFLLLNAAVSDLTQDALIQIVGGKSPDDVLPDFSKQIKQKLAA